jgi:hypothetical protein
VKRLARAADMSITPDMLTAEGLEALPNDLKRASELGGATSWGKVPFVKCEKRSKIRLLSVPRSTAY